ncbi:hypothetical protein CJJ23_04975, partial [Mycoplasmopsis agassizii]
EIQNKIVSILDEFSRLEAELEAELEARNKQYSYYLNHLLNFENSNINFKELKLNQVSEIKTGDELKVDKMNDEYQYPVMGGGFKPTGKYHDWNYENLIVVAKDGAYAGFVNWMEGKFWATSGCFIVEGKEDVVSTKYLYYSLKLKENQLRDKKQGAGVPHLYKGPLGETTVKIPPLEEQNRIVNILDKFSKLTSDINEGLPAEIKMRRQQY